MAVQHLDSFRKPNVNDHHDCWVRPETNMIKINMDGAIDFSHKIVAVGIIARSTNGFSLGC